MVIRTRFELVTPWLKVTCSTDWANGPSLQMAGVPGFEPGECQSQSLMPYRLAIPQQSGGGGQIWTAEPRGNWFTVNRVWPLRYSSKLINKRWIFIRFTPLIKKWWMLRGSNPRPSPCKGDALPTELSIRTKHLLTMLLKYITFISGSQHFL